MSNFIHLLLMDIVVVTDDKPRYTDKDACIYACERILVL